MNVYDAFEALKAARNALLTFTLDEYTFIGADEEGARRELTRLEGNLTLAVAGLRDLISDSETLLALDAYHAHQTEDNWKALETFLMSDPG